jgi:hypothetical protein
MLTVVMLRFWSYKNINSSGLSLASLQLCSAYDCLIIISVRRCDILQNDVYQSKVSWFSTFLLTALSPNVQSI